MAGRRGVCPDCGAKFRIPEQSDAAAINSGSRTPTKGKSALQAKSEQRDGEGDSHVALADAADAAENVSKIPGPPNVLTEIPNAVWYVKPPDGEQMGPAKADVLRQWVSEGKVAKGAYVWREGWADWDAAENVFENLPPSAADSHEAVETPEISLVVDGSPTAQRTNASVKRRGRPGQRNSMLWVVCLLGFLSVALLIGLFYIISSSS